METVKYTLPAFWAPALINGDESGMFEDELTALRAFEDEMLEAYGACWCIDCTDDTWLAYSHDATQYGVMACEVMEFMFDATNRHKER